MPSQGLQALGRLFGRGKKKGPGGKVNPGSVSTVAQPPTPGSNQTNNPAPNTASPVNQTTTQGMPPPQQQGVGSAASGSTAPPSVAGQAQITQQQQAASFDPTAAEGALQDILSGMQKPGLFQGRLRQEQNQYRTQIQQALEGGVTQEELAGLQTSLGSESFKKHERGASAFAGSAMDRLRALGSAGGTAAPGPENPFAAQQVQERYGPQVQNIYDEAVRGEDQQLASDQAIREQTGELYGQIEDTRLRAGENIGTLQDEARAQHGAFTEERQGLSQQAMQMPQQVTQQYDQSIAQFSQATNSAQAIIDGKETAALATVMQGKSQAMSAAVQGIQGNINNQIAQINGNPNLTAGQREQMIAQVRMSGLMQIGPTVGSTIHQFTETAANTAVAFGNMTTQIQGQGLAGQQALLGARADAFAQTTVAANQLAAGLLNTQATANSNYISNQANLESLRTNIELSGDSLRAQLLPGMGIPYANYHDAMVENLQMDFDLSKTEFQSMMGQYGLQLQAWMAAQQARGGLGAMLGAVGQSFGGPLGQALGAGGAAITAFGGMQQQAPMPPGTGGQTFGLDQPKLF